MPGLRKRMTVEMGHDSFLDIVANLVGILIILVVILGVRSQQVAQKIEEDKNIAKANADRIATEKAKTFAARHASIKLTQTLHQYDAELAQRQTQRTALLAQVDAAKETWNRRQEEQDEKSRQLATLATQRTAIKKRLRILRSEREQLKVAKAPVVTVEHLPTPMAKTVFGDEVHFRLKKGLLSVVPLKRLVDQIRQDLSRSVTGREGFADASVGPIQGYVARYGMYRDRQRVVQGGTLGLASRIQLVGLMIEPTTEPFGQPLSNELKEASALDVELAGRNPSTTTITVWVYPGSFAEFGDLKTHLYKRGFATAARPLPYGRPIMGGPKGSRSNAQ